jgi:hypothetical protein
LIGFWFVGALISDIYRATPVEDSVRGWSKIIFFCTDLTGLILLTKRDYRLLISFILGLSCSFLIEVSLFPNEFMQLDPWKFGYSMGLTPIVAVIASTNFVRHRFGLVGSATLFLVISATNLAFNFRSMFALSAAAGILCLVKAFIDIRPKRRARFNPVTFTVLMLGGWLASSGLIAVYSEAASSGILGIEAKEKYQYQTSGDLYLLQAGRNESLVSVQAIADSPILGHGSWARDASYVALLADLLEEHGMVTFGGITASNVIPSHSYFVQSWIEAGILGGLFWILILVVATLAIYKSLKYELSYFPFVAYSLMFLNWDIFFSPFGADQRFLAASRICVALFVLGRNPPLGGETDPSSLSRRPRRPSTTSFRQRA